MSYEYHTEITSQNHSGPRGADITGITWHHWGDDGLFNDSQDDDEARGIAKYLSRPGGDSSAHLVISGRDVYQIVPDGMYAWHAGNTEGNQKTIGIEVDPDAEKQADTYATCAEVTRDLENHHGRLRFYRHDDWKATACPGDLDIDRIRRMADTTTTDPEDDMPTAQEIAEAVWDHKIPVPSELHDELGSKPRPARQIFASVLVRSNRAEDLAREAMQAASGGLIVGRQTRTKTDRVEDAIDDITEES